MRTVHPLQTAFAKAVLDPHFRFPEEAFRDRPSTTTWLLQHPLHCLNRQAILVQPPSKLFWYGYIQVICGEDLFFDSEPKCLGIDIQAQAVSNDTVHKDYFGWHPYYVPIVLIRLCSRQEVKIQLLTKLLLRKRTISQRTDIYRGNDKVQLCSLNSLNRKINLGRLMFSNTDKQINSQHEWTNSKHKMHKNLLKFNTEAYLL